MNGYLEYSIKDGIKSIPTFDQSHSDDIRDAGVPGIKAQFHYKYLSAKHDYSTQDAGGELIPNKLISENIMIRDGS